MTFRQDKKNKYLSIKNYEFTELYYDKTSNSQSKLQEGLFVSENLGVVIQDYPSIV